MAQVTITHFTRIIQNNLYQGFEWLTNAVNHDSYSDGKAVQIPISGAKPTIKKNRSSYPISVTERTDTTRGYDLDKYDAGAILVPEDDKRELSYDKAKSIMSEYMDILNENMGFEGAYNWSPSQAARIISTTGSGIAANPAASVLTRKAIKLADLAKVAALLANDKAYKLGKMWCLIPADMYWSMLTDNPEMLDSNYMSTANLPKGVISQIYGFNMIITPVTTIYSNSDVKNAVGASTLTTDNWSALFWNEDFVCRAKGNIKVFLDKDSATYQGDIYSAYVRFNAVQMRNSGVGTAVLVQG